MTNVVVGSKALNHFFPNVKWSDIDVWTDEPFDKKKGYDICAIPTSILHLIPTDNGYATLDALYTIKCSHLGYSNPKWNKHKLDVLSLYWSGAKIVEPLYEALLDFWKTELHNKSFLSLNKSKDEFFTDNVNYLFDHDYLHELVAHPNAPIYTKLLKENCDVMLDKQKFDMLEFEYKVRLFREEIAVIAVERWLLHKPSLGWFKAHSLSLEKTITTLTKGWATDFIVRNLEHFVKPDFSYYKHILEVLNVKC